MILWVALGTRLGGVCVYEDQYIMYMHKCARGTTYVLYTCMSVCAGAVCLFLCTCF